MNKPADGKLGSATNSPPYAIQAIGNDGDAPLELVKIYYPLSIVTLTFGLAMARTTALRPIKKLAANDLCANHKGRIDRHVSFLSLAESGARFARKPVRRLDARFSQSLPSKESTHGAAQR